MRKIVWRHIDGVKTPEKMIRVEDNVVVAESDNVPASCVYAREEGAIVVLCGMRKYCV